MKFSFFSSLLMRTRRRTVPCRWQRGQKSLIVNTTMIISVLFVCRNVGSKWALEQAKYNLVNEYLLVGVTEELEDFIMILEAALPRFFKGATELYRTGTNTTHTSPHSLCYCPVPVVVSELCWW